MGKIVGTTDADETSGIGCHDGLYVVTDGLFDGLVASLEVGLSVSLIINEGVLVMTKGLPDGRLLLATVGVVEGTAVEVGYVDGIFVAVEFTLSLFHLCMGIESHSSSK